MKLQKKQPSEKIIQKENETRLKKNKTKAKKSDMKLKKKKKRTVKRGGFSASRSIPDR